MFKVSLYTWCFQFNRNNIRTQIYLILVAVNETTVSKILDQDPEDGSSNESS